MPRPTQQDNLSSSELPVYALLGFMGAGKSTLGRKVARDMGRSFRDVDEQIELSEAMAIRSIFEQKGEAEFRNIESQTLKETILQADPGSIVSTGGGAPCFHDNLRFLKEHTVTLFLDVSPKELARRLEPNRAERPLLRQLSPDQFLQWIEQKLEERMHWYRQAEIVISSDQLTVAELLQWIQWHESGFLQ